MQWLSPPAWLMLAVPLRLALDGLWGIDTPVGSAGQLGSGLLFASFTALAVHRWRQAITHPLRWPMAAFAVTVAMGAMRAPDLGGAASWGLHLLTPVVWLLAIRAWGLPARAVEIWVAVGAIPVAIGVAALLLGQPAHHVLHGWPRLLGIYGNVHTHAGVMAVLTVSALTVALLERPPRAWALGIGAGASLCLALTFVRTGWLWAVVAAVGTAWALRRGPVRGSAAVLAVLGLASATLAAATGRLDDLAALITLTPPEGGFSQLGSSRVHIWSASMAAFAAGGPVDLVLGRGLGGHQGLHRHFDPHSEVLALWIQLGLAGLLAWCAWVGMAIGLLVQRARSAPPATRPIVALAFGLLLGAAVTAPLSNDWLTRATVTLWTWGVVGWALAPGGAAGSARSRPPPPA